MMKIKVNRENTEFLKEYSKVKNIDRNFFFGKEEVKISYKDFLKTKKVLKTIKNGDDPTFIYGYRNFYKDTFKIKRKVFVPQPDTEGIFELVNPELKRGLEVGVGSGVISTSLAKHFGKEMTAIDINKRAIELAGYNSGQNAVNITLKNRDVFKYEPKEKFDFLISNPPYIKVGDKNVEQWVKDNQPFEALYADDDGLIFYKFLMFNATRFINEGGELYFEIGWNQKDALEAYIKANELGEYNFHKDLEGNWRFLKLKI